MVAVEALTALAHAAALVLEVEAVVRGPTSVPVVAVALVAVAVAGLVKLN